MWIKSKFESGLINTALCHTIIKKNKSDDDRFRIKFEFDDGSIFWSYPIENDRDQEYNWILSQLNCRVNDGNMKKGKRVLRCKQCKRGPCLYEWDNIKNELTDENDLDIHFNCPDDVNSSYCERILTIK